MKPALVFCVLAVVLAGCAAPIGGSDARPATPGPNATPMAFATKVPQISAAEAAAIEKFGCALVPVRVELGTASRRYDDAEGAMTAQLATSAKLDMSDAITHSRKAQSALQSLTTPSQLTTYQDLLSSAASSFLVAAPALRDDYASSNVAAAKSHAKAFLAGRRYLHRADAAWQSLSRHVTLPAKDSPRCTQAYLQKLILQTNGPPPTAGPKPTARPKSTARPRARHKPGHRTAPAPTRTPAPRHAKRSQHSASQKSSPTPTAPRRAKHRAATAAERSYMVALGHVTSGAKNANRYVSTASVLIAQGRGSQVAALLDHATQLVDAASSASRQLHAPPRSLSTTRTRSARAVTDTYVAIRKLRLYLIDTVGRNTAQAQKDLASARLSLKQSRSSVTHASQTLERLAR